jgi:hypothetical protein
VYVLVHAERDRGVGVAHALRDDLHRHTIGQQQGGVGVPPVVRPDHRQSLLQRLARANDLAGEAAGEPLGAPVGAAEVAEHEGRVSHEVEGQQSASYPRAAERGHGAWVEVDDPGPAGLGRALDQSLPGTLGVHHANAAADSEAAGVQVDVPPAQGRRLPVAASRQPVARSGSSVIARVRNRPSSGRLTAAEGAPVL